MFHHSQGASDWFPFTRSSTVAGSSQSLGTSLSVSILAWHWSKLPSSLVTPFFVFIILACVFSEFRIYVSCAVFYPLPHCAFWQIASAAEVWSQSPVPIQLLCASRASSAPCLDSLRSLQSGFSLCSLCRAACSALAAALPPSQALSTHLLGCGQLLNSV